jgi:hypothetical protein
VLSQAPALHPRPYQVPWRPVGLTAQRGRRLTCRRVCGTFGVSKPPGPNNFDRSKPFYPLTVHFICQLFGFNELAARGLVDPLQHGLQQAEDPAAGAASTWRGRLARERSDRAHGDGCRSTRTHAPLDLGSKVNGSPIHVEAAEIAADIAANSHYLSGWMMRSAGSLLIIAWESTEDFHDQEPLWEFLKHCRHAAATTAGSTCSATSQGDLPNGFHSRSPGTSRHAPIRQP